MTNQKVIPLEMTKIDTIFRALAHPIRRSIIESLGSQSVPTVILADQYQISLEALIKHVKILEDAGLVRTHRSGRNKMVAPEISSLKAVYEYADRFISAWDEKYQTFKKNVESSNISQLSYVEEQD